jgi:glycosyltransferase involved in cell wall biosynthesis
VYQDIPSEVEVMLDCGLQKLKEFLEERSHYYDLIFISRPHNMTSFKSIISKNSDICGRARIVYDAEALFCYREIEQRRLEGQGLSEADEAQLIKDEVSLADNCDCIISVSDRENREFSRYGCESVYTLGHSVEIAPTKNDFEERGDILFVGAIHSLNSPNADSMIWFSNDILPLIQESLGKEFKLIIAGPSCQEFQAHLNNNRSVQLLGVVNDLTPLYNRARLFIAPTRFSAGIPLKVCEAGAYGLPVVATSLTGIQLGWNHEQELLLADTPQDFASACVRLYGDPRLWNRLRDNIINRVKRDFSPEAFSKQLQKIID